MTLPDPVLLPDLPPARSPDQYRVGLVCLGNICRSPMADVVLNARVVEAGLDDQVSVVSCGTGDWHVGQPMDHRSAAVLTSNGYDAERHRAQQFATTWLDAHDVLLAMDEQNLTDLGGRTERVRLFRDFDPVGTGGVVPDPYYGGDNGFEEVLTMIERTSEVILARLHEALSAR